MNPMSLPSFHHSCMKETSSILALGLSTAFSMIGTAEAASVYASYTGTVATSGFLEVPAGSSIIYIVEMDNGGSSLLNQTWNQSDLRSIIFSANDGAILTTFEANRSLSSGSFASDGTGALSLVAEIFDEFVIRSTNLSKTNQGVSINGNNSVFYGRNDGEPIPSPSISEVDPSENQNEGNWTLSTSPPPIPEPTSAILLGFAALTSLVSRRRK